MAERAATTRDSVVDFAADHGWSEIWPRVMQARAALLAELVDVSEALASRPPSGGEGEDAWNMTQVTQHVLTYTRNVVSIIESTARGEQVVKDPPGAIHDVGMTSWRGLIDVVVEASADLAVLYRRLPAEPDLETTVAHPVFGPFNCREWFLFLSVHDEAHHRQIISLKSRP